MLKDPRVAFGLKLLVTVVAAYFIFQRFPSILTQLSQKLAVADFRFFVLALVLLLLSHTVAVWRWQRCCSAFCPDLRKQTVSGKLLGEFWRVYFIGLFFSNFLPGAFGGDIVRAFYLDYKSKRMSLSVAVITVLFDRLFGILNITWIGFATCLYFRESLPAGLIWGMSIAFAFSMFGLILFFTQRYQPKLVLGWSAKLFSLIPIQSLPKFLVKTVHKIEELFAFTVEVSRQKSCLRDLIISSASIQVLVSLCLLSLLAGLQISVNPLFVFLLQPVSTLGTLFVPSMNGLGVREGIFLYLFDLFDYSGQDGVILSFTWLIVYTVASIPGIFFFLNSSMKKLKQIK